MHPLRFGLKLSQNATIDTLTTIWGIADDSGFDHCWNMDHFASLGGDDTLDIFEAWTLLAGMAARTTRTRVGCSVTGNTYRHPAVLAKAAVTVDHLSGGRLEFGIGAGWAENEHTMLGPAVRHRPRPRGLARGGAADHPVAVDGAAHHVPGQAVPADRGGRRAEAGADATPADLDRRRRAAAHPADGRRARRRVERAGWEPGGGGRAVRRARRALRRHRSGPGRDPPVGADPGARRRGRARRPGRGLRRRRWSPRSS
jgi:alkanesulfonate monooxygenase SsuD/methylene tetrahydromethanopterin reductase-like flavin-dependent oxidoreductase (luciferase family)